MNFSKNENSNSSNRSSDQSGSGEGTRKRAAAVKSTGGKAPRKQLSEKTAKMTQEQERMRRYEHRLLHGRRSEVECQTYESKSDVQTQSAPETKDSAAQTKYNYRFYMDYSDDEDQE